MSEHIEELLSYLGRPLPTGPSSLRNWFRKMLDAPKGDPVREACEDWAKERAKSGPEFAVPTDWFPRGYELPA